MMMKFNTTAKDDGSIISGQKDTHLPAAAATCINMAMPAIEILQIFSILIEHRFQNYSLMKLNFQTTILNIKDSQLSEIFIR